MSLKFGLWLVEQGLVSCDQFCGLVKIQQESLPSPSTVAFRANLMTLRQVSTVQEQIASSQGGDFLEIAGSLGFINGKTAETILQLQSLSATSIESLCVLCGLLSKEQARVLKRHFQQGKNTTQTSGQKVAETETSQSPPANQDKAHPVPEPKFRQRPVIVHQYDVTY